MLPPELLVEEVIRQGSVAGDSETVSYDLEIVMSQAAERYLQGDYTAARSIYQRALTILERVLGSNSPDTARCLNALAKVMEEQGDPVAAKQAAERALAICEQVFGAEHPDTAMSLHVLGVTRFDLGDFHEGVELVERALAIRVRTLGEEHPDTIESMKSLGLMSAVKVDHDRGVEILTRALSICERVFGDNHRTTVKVLNALGVVWAKDKSTRAQARGMYERALNINERLKGADHPDTAQSLNNLAALLADMEDHATAIPLLERSLALHERVLGPKNPRVSFVLTNLADIYKKQGNYGAARPLLQRALIIREQSLGARHLDTIKSLRKLVGALGVLQKQGDETALLVGMPLHTCLMALEAGAGILDPSNRNMPGARLDPAKAAERLHKLVADLEAEMNRPPLSASDQSELRSARNLYDQAGAVYDKGDYPLCQSLLEKALAIQERILGKNHLEHVELIKKLANTKRKRGEYSAVLPLMQRIADIYAQVLGPEHPKATLALVDLAGCYSQEYGLAAAIPLHEQILKLNEEALDPEEPSVVRMRDSIDRLKASLAKRGVKQIPAISRSERRERALASLPPERQGLLAGIDQIDWHSVHHAYGPADDVSNLLRLLLSDDEQARDDAWEELYGNVWHQGTIYEATAYVVPFFLKMLTYEGPPGRKQVLGFLSAVAEGSSYLAAHAQGERENKWREILTKQGRDLEAERQKERGWVEAANRAVGEGAPIYFDLLSHEDAEIRRLSLGVLASLRGRSDEIVPRLRAFLSSEQDPETRAEMVRALHALMDDGAEAQHFFDFLMRQRESEKMTFIAAVALTRRAREQTPDAAVAIILDAIVQLGTVRRDDRATWETIRSRFDQGWGGLEFAEDALVWLGPARAVPTLLRVLRLIYDPENSRRLAGILLDFVFNDGLVQPKSTAISLKKEGDGRRHKVDYWEPKPQPPRQASTLTDMQRPVLATLVAHDPLWTDEHNLLRLYGLPISREDLRQFIA